jgi:hypothetical protein
MEYQAMAGQIKLTISIENGAVVITADDGKKGGNVRSRSLRRISWERQTGPNKVDSFDLTFERLSDAEGALATVADFPLLETKVQPASAAVNEDAGTVSGAHRFGGRLAEAGTYKYSVVARDGGNTYTLDPIIIIEE